MRGSSDEPWASTDAHMRLDDRAGPLAAHEPELPSMHLYPCKIVSMCASYFVGTVCVKYGVCVPGWRSPTVCTRVYANARVCALMCVSAGRSDMSVLDVCALVGFGSVSHSTLWTAEIDVIGALQNLSSEQLERVMAAYRKHQGIV
jgi:hypothetical protein